MTIEMVHEWQRLTENWKSNEKIKKTKQKKSKNKKRTFELSSETKFDRKKYKTISVGAFIVVMFTETVGVDNKLNLIRFLLFPLDLDPLCGQKIVLASWL